MAHPEEVAQWTATVAKGLPQLSPAHARVLALWSYGMVMTRSCACHTVALFLGLLLGKGTTRCGTACARGATTRPTNAGSITRRWMSQRASPRCWPGCCGCGRATRSRWPSMPRAWATASWS